MNTLHQWCVEHNVANPHDIPDDLKAEFDEKFKDAAILFPQPGGQVEFQNCPADIAFYGGEAGAGKSWSLLFDQLKWTHLKGYIGVIARKNYSQIFDAGGLWQEARELYSPLRGHDTKGDKPRFVFPSGAQIYFKHSQHASKVDEYWQGLQAAVIGIDEVTQFEKSEFLYIMSRNRSMTGIDSYIRATCNPDPRSWVRDMIDWWIDKDGFIIPERSGVIRYFVHRDDKFVWGDTKEELEEKFGVESYPKSFTFIRGHLEDNQKLLEQDPEYIGRLENLTSSQKRALREGNWNELDNPDSMFTRANFNANRVEYKDPDTLERIVVGVDPAGGTKEENDETGIIAGGIDSEGIVYIFTDKSGRYKPPKWAEKSCNLYDSFKADKIVCERNFGGDMVQSTIEMYRASTNDNKISDIHPKMVTASRGKAIRAEPVATLYEHNRIKHVGHNMKELEDEMADYEPGQSKSPNRLDALVWVVTELAIKQPATPNIRVL